MPVCRKEAKKKSLLKDNFATDKQKLKKLVDKIKYEKNR